MKFLIFIALIFVCHFAAAKPDNPIDLSNPDQIHAEYFAHGNSLGTFVFLSGDGAGAGQGFDENFAAKCVAFQHQGWNVIAVQSKRWLRALGTTEIANNKCLDISSELTKTVTPLLPQNQVGCLSLVGFSYGTGIATAAYLESPKSWCGLVTLSWCKNLYLQGHKPSQSICRDASDPSAFSYTPSTGLFTMNRYTGPTKSLIVQGTLDQVCEYSPTSSYLINTNGTLVENDRQSLRRISVMGSDHNLTDENEGYPWLGDFSRFILELQAEREN